MKILLAAIVVLVACHHGRSQPSAARTPSAPQLAQPVFVNPYANADVDCRSAAALLRRADDGTPIMGPSLWRVRSCPTQAGILLAALLDSSRHVRDTSEMERRTRLTQYVHDSRLLAAAMNVASDADATVDARLAAIRTMIWSKSPGNHLTMSMMRTTPRCMPPCHSSYEGHFYGPSPYQGPEPDTTTWPVSGAPMRAGYVVAIDSMFTALVLTDTSESVRNAAAIGLRFPQAARLRGR